MKKYLFVIVILSSVLSANTSQSECTYLKDISIQAKDLYKKFKDASLAVKLLNDVGYRLNPSEIPTCLTYDEFREIEKTFIFLNAKAKREEPIKNILKYNPNDTYVLKALASLYKERYLDMKPDMPRRELDDRFFALKYYEKYVQNGGSLDAEEKKFVSTRGFKKAKDRWFDMLQIVDVPEQAYKVIYFDKSLDKLIKTETVDIPAINLPDRYFEKVNTHNLKIYWVGDIYIEDTQDSEIYIDASNGSYRVIIDGYEVLNAKHTRQTAYRFTKGKHRIEVEFSNASFRCNFMMSIAKRDNYIKNRLNLKQMIKDEKILFVAIKKASNHYKKVDVHIKDRFNEPIILVLSSAESIHWVIDPGNARISKIFVSSNTLASSVESMIEDSSNPTYNKVYKVQNSSNVYDLDYKCECGKYGVNCYGSKIYDLYRYIYTLFHKELYGYMVGKADIKTSTIHKATNQELKILEQQYKKMHQLKNRCKKMMPKKMDIDDIF